MSEDLIRRRDAIKAVVSLHVLGNEQAIRKEYEKYSPSACVQFEETLVDVLNAIEAIPSADRPQGEWVDCKEPPSTDRNVFIAYGTDDMKSVCIGHYEHDMKLWYEDKNFFAKPKFDAMYWCEIPQFPTKAKGADDGIDD